MKNPYSEIPTTVLLLVAMTLVSRSGSMVLVFLPLYLTQELNFSILITGQIISFYGLGEIIGSFIGGMLSDKTGLFLTQSISFFLVGISYLTLEFFHTSLFILLAIFFAGLFTATARPATGTAISKLTSPSVRPKAYALNYQAVNLGTTIGPAIGGLLASINYGWLFAIDGIANIIAAIMVWIFFGRKTHTILKHNETPTSIHSTPIWKNTFFIAFLLLTLLMGICFFQAFSVYPLFLKEKYQLSESHIGLVMAFNGLLIILFQMYLTSYFKKFNPLKVAGFGGLFICLGFAILPLSHGLYYAFFSMLIITIGEMISMPLLFNFVAEISPASQRGVYIGVFIAFLSSVPLLIAPSMSSYIYNTLGFKTLWFGTGILGVFIFIGFLLLKFHYTNHNSKRDA